MLEGGAVNVAQVFECVLMSALQETRHWATGGHGDRKTGSHGFGWESPVA